MSNVVWSFEPEYVYPESGGAGSYYWTNCWYWLQDETIPTPIPSIRNQLLVISQNCQASVSRRFAYRIRSIPAIGYDVITTAGPLGNIPVSGGLLLTTIVQLTLLKDGKWIGYKRLRGPWGTGQILDGQWSAAFLSNFTSFVIPRFALIPLCNIRGVPYDSGRVSPTLYPWQQRHGTARRTRTVFA
jgi:hypothetical protein